MCTTIQVNDFIKIFIWCRCSNDQKMNICMWLEWMQNGMQISMQIQLFVKWLTMVDRRIAPSKRPRNEKGNDNEKLRARQFEKEMYSLLIWSYRQHLGVRNYLHWACAIIVCVFFYITTDEIAERHCSRFFVVVVAFFISDLSFVCQPNYSCAAPIINQNTLWPFFSSLLL